MTTPRKVPLHDFHVSLGGRMVDFAGYLMPVRYTTIIEEHDFTRHKAGLFDVSHMGEFILEGPNARKQLDHLITRSLTRAVNGQVLYALLANHDGGTVDDILVYQFTPTRYLLIVNASNIAKDHDWIRTHLSDTTGSAHGPAELAPDPIRFSDVSDQYCLFALQGPLAEPIIARLGLSLSHLKYYTFLETDFCNRRLVISRTGYTGEDGFEILIENTGARTFIDALVRAGGNDLRFCGLGCRDLCRLEAGYPLYGHELSDTLNPLISPSRRVIHLDKPDFVGKSALIKLTNPTEKLIGFQMADQSIPREGYRLLAADRDIGFVTSGIYSPLRTAGIGMGYVAADFDGSELTVAIRGKQCPAKLTPLPFYANVKK